MSVQRTPGGLLKTTFSYKTVIGSKLQNNPSVGYRRQLPFHSGAKADVKIENIYLQPKFDVNRLFMCKPAVCIGVQ